MKRSLSAVVLCFFLLALSGCSIGSSYSIGNEKRSYINVTYIDVNTSYKAPDEAKGFLSKNKNKCVKWTAPVKSILNDKYLVLQAGNLCQVYAQFDKNISKSGKFNEGQYVTVSGYLESYCQSLLGESPYWTLKNCRIEDTSSADKEALASYLSTAAAGSSDSSQSGQTAQNSSNSTAQASSASQSSAFSIKVSDFKTSLLAKDKNFTELPSFKDGGNDALGDYYYTYQTGESKSKYEIFLNASGDKIYSIELMQNTTVSDAEKTRAQTVYNDLLSVIYGIADTADYNTASQFVKEFVTRNAKYNDFHVASTTAGNYKISLEMRNRTQEFRMSIEMK